jgi:hypothetical protein
MAAISILLSLLDFLFGIILIFFTIIIFHPINKLKRYKVKEDQLFLQKTLITTIFFCLFLLLNLLSYFSDDLKKYTYIASNFVFNAFVMILIIYNLLISIELYYTFNNPAHYFNRLFRQYKHNYLQELFIIIVTIVTIGLDFAICYKNLEKHSDEKIDDISLSFMVLNDEWKPFCIIILSIINLIVYGKIKSKVNKFYFTNQDKLVKVISRRSLNIYLYLIYGIFHIFPLIAKLLDDDSAKSEYFKLFSTLFFYIVIIDDYIIQISEIATSKFCEYRLKKTVLGYFCSCIYKPRKPRTGAMQPLVNESSMDKSDFSSFQNDFSNTLDLVSNSINDKELVNIYKNNIFIEDYYLGYFDQFLNIITASLYQVYNSKYFSTQANERNLTNKLKIEDISAIGGNMKDTSVSAINTKAVVNAKNEIGEDTVRFNFDKNLHKDDLKRFEDVLENKFLVRNNNNYLDISINSYLTTRCVECIYDQKIKGKNVGDSLISHMILSNISKNRNPENPRANYWSLLASNGKEQYFNKLRNTSIKTFDKNFVLDIFDTDDGDVNFFEKGINNSLAQLLDKYFTYIHGKGVNGTFIPSLVGIFKIKINNFKTLLIFITKNSIVENAPKSFFSYWQLLRILKGKPQKIASSQFSSRGSFIKDDPIFDRAFQIETIKDNPNYNKICFRNYSEFQGIINSDIEFMRQVGAKNFDLLLMYYEYENTQKHEKQGAIKIRQTNKGAEFVEESMPKGFLDEEGGTSLKEKKGSFDGDFLNFGKEGFLDEENFGGDNFNMRKVMKDLDSFDKSNMNGYEGLFDNFNCICYFIFENIFDIRQRNSVNDEYYGNVKDNILKYFAESKK